jgi:hypothetical protein
MPEEHITQSFVARIWLEHGDNGDVRWRGHIRHVQGEEESYFQNLTDMRDFLGCVSGVAGLPLTADGGKEVPRSLKDTVTNIKPKD